MKWTILAVGRLRESYWQAAAAEYLKRLGPYRPVEVVELPEDDGRMLAAIKPDVRLIALWERGEQLDSAALAARLADMEHDGAREAVFAIGGANGLDPAVLARADWKLGLSRLTLPHQLARVVLVEQLYRAERIRRGEPYHK